MLYVHYTSIKLEKKKKRRLGRRHAQREDHVKTQGEDGHLQAKERDLRRNQTCQHRESRLLVSRIVTKCVSGVYPTQSVIFCYGSSSNWTHLGWGNWLPMWKENEIIGTSLVVQWLRLQAPNAAGPGSIPGQGTRSQMPQLRVCRPQIKILHAATKIPHVAVKIPWATTKTWCSQKNK